MIKITDGTVTLARFWNLSRALRFVNEYWQLFGVSLKMEEV